MSLRRERKISGTAARCAGLLLALSGAVVLGSGAVTACKGADDGADSQNSAETAMDKADWLEKTARLLRNGEGLGPHDDVDALLAMDQGAVVDQFMQDPRFGDMVAAFDLFYLSRSFDRLKQPANPSGFAYDSRLFEWPQVLASAQAVMKGGNYFDLFSATPPAFRRFGVARPQTLPVGGSGAGDGGAGDGGAPPLTFRQMVESAFAAANAQIDTDPKQACILFSSGMNSAVSELSRIGYPAAFSIRSRWLVAPTPAFPNTIDCGRSDLTSDAIRAPLAAIEGAVRAIFAAVDAAPGVPAVNSITDIPAYPSHFDGLPPLVSPWGSTQWSSLPATSTNFQRKRAAYILRTYFCDDLTPNSIPATVDAGGQDEKHASNPNCQACHYRLDPMGALFRNLGSFGSDQSAQNTIRFDDFVTFSGDQFQQYLSQWRNPDGTFRAGKYVIGADGTPTLDSSWLDAGDTLDALWSYLPRSDAARACLTRRLAEYVLGSRQVYDRDWLTQIARQAKFKPGMTSGAGFKAMVKTLVLSKTFSTQDPKPGVCYDVPANAPANRPPCAVANIVANQCADCHSSVQARGHLDLTQWTLQADGAFSWPHNDDAGNPLSRSDSLKRILERITSPDSDKRMPFQRSLEADDLDTLKTWLTSNLSPSSSDPPASP